MGPVVTLQSAILCLKNSLGHLGISMTPHGQQLKCHLIPQLEALPGYWRWLVEISYLHN